MSSPLESLVREARGDGAAATRAAARLMSTLENQPQRLPDFIKAAGSDASQPRLILGITGAPGSGKSTLTDAMIGEYRRRAPEQKIGVIAVDPSSPFTGGAVLGDRVRMMRHATDPNVFVRSLASRGHLGGLALGVKGVLRVMGIIGADVVILETVGVGQSEVEVARVADEVLVVLAPGQGDSIQLLKAGLMEVGDFIVVNKADREGASELHAQVLAALQLESDATKREVALVSAAEGRGVAELVESVENRAAEYSSRRAGSLEEDMREAILESARERLLARMENDGEMRVLFERVVRGEVGADNLVRALLNEAPSTPEEGI